MKKSDDKDNSDNVIETQVFRTPGEANRRIRELNLTRPGLLRVRAVAVGASADVTGFHTANAAGTFSYQYGTWALRNEFVGDEWKVDRTDGVESICNEAKQIKVIFCNVDIACDDEQLPKPRSKKGAGSERACIGNLFEYLPIYTPRANDGWATYYLMLDTDGAAELTRPVIKGDTFSSYIERIYLAASSDPYDDSNDTQQEDIAVNLDPLVARKK